ncbi:hypothetical protein C2845_PM09G03750 [Panicum miliaceum]|uniref:Uncharacterized protein n=1 Tax=Panicum miliaceum TaxID=4540 RepID=A0A3L6RZD0_PANMI|nr:hypothetical protein C2845_PM09G03750 [Panicum miliaceum]
MAARHCLSWADFLPELLGLVVGRLPLADRARFGAVCRLWRRAAQQEPLPPPLPWLNLPDGTFLSVPGGEIHRMPVPEDAVCYGSVGNWLFLRRSGGEFSLADPFSGDVVRLPEQSDSDQPGRPISFKPVLLSTLDLSLDSPFAVLTINNSFEAAISFCRLRDASATTFIVPDCKRLYDVAFFDGKLYALSLSKLYAIETGSSSKGEPTARVPYIERVVDAVDNPGIMCPGPLPARATSACTEATSLNPAASCCTWRRLGDLGGRALFVSRQSHSRSLPASECGAREDCIYFVRDYDRGSAAPDPTRDCGVFDMRTGVITPLLPDTVVVRRQGCKGRPAWFFPTKTM